MLAVKAQAGFQVFEGETVEAFGAGALDVVDDSGARDLRRI